MAPVGPAGPDRRPLGAPGVRGRVRYRSTWRATRSAPGLVLRGLLTAPLLVLSLFYGWMLERASISVLAP